jgi:hypothetical protein
VNGDCVEGLDKDAVISKILQDIKQVDLLVAKDYRPYLENKPNFIINSNKNRRGSMPSVNRTRSNSAVYSSERKFG